MGGYPDRVLRRLIAPLHGSSVAGLCPFCLVSGTGGLTDGFPASALVLVATAFVIVAAVGRLFWRVWRREDA